MTTFMENYRAPQPATDTMPRDDSGDFLYQEFDNPVRRTRFLEEDETRHAKIIKEKVWMEDGTHYDVTSTLAKNRTIDIGILATSAWLTQDGGLNQDRALRSARLGIDTVFVSPQQNLTRRGRFGKSVCNMIRIADHFHLRHDRDPDNLWVDGISRGGMHALGVAAKAPYVDDDKQVIYGDYTVPCFPDGLQPAKDLAMLPRLITNELGASTALLQIPFSTLKHYPNTVSLSPKKQFQQLKEVPALLSGKVGEAARNMPPETFGHVTNYLGDIMGQGSRWAPILSPYENITVENFKGGGHVSMTSPRCQAKWETRLRAVHEAIKQDPKLPSLGTAALASVVRENHGAVFKHRPIVT